MKIFGDFLEGLLVKKHIKTQDVCFAVPDRRQGPPVVFLSPFISWPRRSTFPAQDPSDGPNILDGLELRVGVIYASRQGRSDSGDLGDVDKLNSIKRVCPSSRPVEHDNRSDASLSALSKIPGQEWRSLYISGIR